MLYRLAYLSRSLLKKGDGDPEKELQQILLSARRNNAEQHVTGALLSTQPYFAQVLEGEEAKVKAIYQKICRDPRHERLTILCAGEIPSRQFGRWAMAHIAGNESVDEKVAQLGTYLPQSVDGDSARCLLSLMGEMVKSQTEKQALNTVSA